MTYILDSTRPECRYFEEICAIPHGSGNEKALSDYIVSFAKARGLWVHQDELYNVIVKKPASPGYEASPPVMLQAHIDMVCEKDKGVEFDFTKDPLELYVEDGWVKARGTTLGADDGCGVAYMLAILDDKNAKHPPLECVFTTNEETGMAGAAALNYSHISARRVVGLDAAGETVTVVASAGGLRIKVTRNVTVVPAREATVSFLVKGLQGGHSGIFINKERGNSIKIAARLLHRLRSSGIQFNLCKLNGGSKENAIPRDCEVVLTCGAADVERAWAVIREVEGEVKAELAHSDPDIRVERLEAGKCGQALSDDDTRAIIDFAVLVPNGVAAMNMAFPGLVQTSNNVGVVEVDSCGCGRDVSVEGQAGSQVGGQADGRKFSMAISLRSSSETGIDELCSRITLLCNLCGMEYQTGSRYPGMEYQPDSPWRQRYAKFMKETWGKELRVVAGHAGGEGGYFASKLPGMQIVHLGPFIEGAHSPSEKMDISSFIRTYEFLRAFLASLTD